MRRLCLVLLGVLCWNPPALAQDLSTKLDLWSLDYNTRRIADELSRMNDDGVRVYRGGSTGGMFSGGGMFNSGVGDIAQDEDGNIVHWSYYAPGMHEKRVKHASRVKRAQAKKAKYAARRVK